MRSGRLFATFLSPCCSNLNIHPLYPLRDVRTRLEQSEVIFLGALQPVGVTRQPFLHLSCRLTMGYCCSRYSSDARHLRRKRERKLFSEGKYSSLGPERNHMRLVFNQPSWILRQGSEKQQKRVRIRRSSRVLPPALLSFVASFDKRPCLLSFPAALTQRQASLGNAQQGWGGLENTGEAR